MSRGGKGSPRSARCGGETSLACSGCLRILQTRNSKTPSFPDPPNHFPISLFCQLPPAYCLLLTAYCFPPTATAYRLSCPMPGFSLLCVRIYIALFYK